MTFADKLLDMFLTEAKKCEQNTFQMHIGVNLRTSIIFRLHRHWTEERYSLVVQLEELKPVDEDTYTRVEVKTGRLIYFVGEPVWASGKALRLAVLALEDKREIVGNLLHVLLQTNKIKEQVEKLYVDRPRMTV